MFEIDQAQIDFEEERAYQEWRARMVEEDDYAETQIDRLAYSDHRLEQAEWAADDLEWRRGCGV